MTDSYPTLDAQVRARLKNWPQTPPGISGQRRLGDKWMRARPAEQIQLCHPFLKLPGSRRFRTLPDGMWLNFGGTPVDPYADIFAIEACSTLQNLLDKRARFAPSTQSLLAVCPVPWLLARTTPEDDRPRWRTIGLLRHEPMQPFILPVRDLKVMYALTSRHYQVATGTLPYPHEYFVPMENLTAEDGDKDPALQALVARACTAGNFLVPA